MNTAATPSPPREVAAKFSTKNLGPPRPFPTTRMRLIFICCMVLGCLASVNSVPVEAAPHRPSLTIPYAPSAPPISADPRNPIWSRGALIPALTLSIGPDAKGLSPLPTQVRVLWNHDYLFVRFVCFGGDLYSPVKGHDAPLFKGDVAEVFIDPVGDGRQFVELEVSPNNSVLDILHLITGPPASGPDGVLLAQVIGRNMWSFPEWNMDGLITATGHLTRAGKVRGWIVDMAIPASSLLKRLGTSHYSPMTLRANFVRYDQLPGPTPGGPRKFIAMNWSPVVWGRPHRAPRAMGMLRLLP